MDHVPLTFHLDVADEDIAAWRAQDPDAEPWRLVLGEHYWIVLSFVRLRDAGIAVRLDNRVPDEGIVVFYAGDKRSAWEAARRGSRALLVAVRSDRNPVGFADIEVVQNAASADGVRAFHVPHWPQPGLLPRDPARGAVPRTLLFPGTPQNLHPGFRVPLWQDFLRARALTFRCHGGNGTSLAWHDYRDVDVMLAIRPSGATEVRNKPAWKLFNAWLAGTPAILGPESGYRELRAGPLDYLEAAGPDEAMAAIDRLLADPGLYAAMVENGLVRGRAYTSAATVRAWCALDSDVLQPAWQALRQRPVGMATRRLRDFAARLRRARGGRA